MGASTGGDVHYVNNAGSLVRSLGQATRAHGASLTMRQPVTRLALVISEAALIDGSGVWSSNGAGIGESLKVKTRNGDLRRMSVPLRISSAQRSRSF